MWSKKGDLRTSTDSALFSPFGCFVIVFYSTLANVTRENVMSETTSTCAITFLRSRRLVSARLGANGRANQRRRVPKGFRLSSQSPGPFQVKGQGHNPKFEKSIVSRISPQNGDLWVSIHHFL
ncbi:hypothetical protein PoB_002509100 [Plakobranchus ocellatus]|uniref:Uncharacterized protein n=1 Tax=Plakobranchus ocellatus TaxID=259542 RepID=A0AAV3ZHF4_9GAST|nr:hypothetical protein PoB_002509100 [Plakobranchus ocellatus]